jgi:hypothetical protein
LSQNLKYFNLKFIKNNHVLFAIIVILSFKLILYDNTHNYYFSTF